MSNLILIERIESKIYIIRGQKVMLDFDLAGLYRVKTKILNQAIRRNIERFPEDFMFQLMWSEVERLRSQFVTLKTNNKSTKVQNKSRRGRHVKYLPYAFTEQGIAMLSSVLRSKMAIAVNIQIMRTFTKLRQILITHEDLRRKIETMEKRYDQNFKVVFDAIKALIRSPAKKAGKIGFLKEKES